MSAHDHGHDGRAVPDHPTPRAHGLLPFLQRWRGVALTLVIAVVTVILGFSGQLGLYIHPRYFVFTIVLAVIALAFVVGALLWRGHVHDDQRTGRRATLVAVAGIVVIGALVVAMVVVPPASLSAASAAQRSMTTGASALLVEDTATDELVSTGATDRLTLGDWSALIARQADPAYFAGMTATMSGFVMPYTEPDDGVFYVARFQVTCCTVDAQPVGVAVLLEDWAGGYPVDSWVEITGSFVPAPDGVSSSVVLEPSEIIAVDEPLDPYEY